MIDLNRIGPVLDHAGPSEPQDNSLSIPGVAVYFRNLETRLIELIAQTDFVVGCVAWLTSASILEALSRVPYGVSIVVQKEDFLRPDIGPRNGRASALRRRYDSLKCSLDRYSIEGLVGSLSVASDPTIQPVRCVGNHNSDKAPAFPRMHNKFLVFCRVDEFPGPYKDGYSEYRITPHAVWTGSFNLTKNAALSLENAVVLSLPKIATAYFNEWQQVLSLSEPLDWESEWCAPEWRIGT